MPKPFKITGPGKYITRDNQVVEVIAINSARKDRYVVEGMRHGVSCYWTVDGYHCGAGDCSADLIRRLPSTPPRKPRPAKAARWGVWVPCTTRKQARACEDEIISRVTHRSGDATVVKRSAK